MSSSVIPNEPEVKSTTETEKQAKKPPVARIVSTKTRSIEVPIEYEIEFDGKVYKSVTVRRCQGREIELYMKAIAASDDDEMPLPPFIDVPVEVWDAMDEDDQFTVDQAAIPFTPRRLLEAAGLAQKTIENTLGK